MARLQEIVDTLRQLGVDETEYAYLKTLVLFTVDHITPGSLGTLERSSILLSQRKASIELRQYVVKTQASDVDRLTQLLLTLLTVRTLKPQVRSGLTLCLYS